MKTSTASYLRTRIMPAVLLPALLVMQAPTSAFANTNICSSIFDPHIISASAVRVKSQAAAAYVSPAVEAYNVLKNLYVPAGTGLVKPMMALLNDEALSSFHTTLKEIATTLQKNVTLSVTSTKADFMNALVVATETELTKTMPASVAGQRAELLRDPSLNKAELMKALGQLSSSESLAALIGPNGIHDVSSDSLVGRYLSLSQAAGKTPTTLVSEFSKGPGYEGRGGEKLFISVDQTTLAAANAAFNSNPNLLMHNHTPGQGTLHMLYDAKDVSYSSFGGASALTSQQNTIVPMIVLSSIEASNAKNYFALGTLQKSYAKYPWGFKNQSAGADETSYCRAGGYGSCTHWIGEMSLGQKFVSDYAFPGNIGDDPYGHPERGADGDATGALRVGPVGTYTHFRSSTVTPIGDVTRIDRLAHIVWTQNLGREQLWSLVGDKDGEGLKNGEWANPGWVLYSFLSRTSQDRVPVVLVMRADASAPLTQADLDALKPSIAAR